MLVFFAKGNLNLFNIVHVKETYFKNQPANLYVAKSARISGTIINRIREMNIFVNIELIDSPTTKKILLFSEIPLLRFLPQMFEIIIDNHNILKNLKESSNNTPYSQIFINKLDLTSTVLLNYFKKYNQNIMISLIEEGGGDMYQTRDRVFFLSMHWKVIFSAYQLITFQWFKRREDIEHVTETYFYMPSKYNSNTGLSTKVIPPITKANDCVASLLTAELANQNMDEYKKRDFIYFVDALAGSVTGNYDNTRKHLDLILSAIPTNQLIIKDHPRSFISKKAKNVLGQYKTVAYIDHRNYLFESFLFMCKNIGEKVLITKDSACAIHPKYMFGEEPYVIFTYKLYSETDQTYSNKLANDLKSTYIQKNKVFIPNNIDEFHSILTKITLEMNVTNK